MIKGFKGKKPKTDPEAYVAQTALVIGDVELGADASIWPGAVLRGDMDRISIGEKSNIQDGCVMHCTKGIPTTVGKGSTVGHNAVLHSCEVGDDTLIGMGAILLDNVKVGNACLVAAGSLLTPGTEIPDGSMVMGSPARVKRSLTDDEKKSIVENTAEYVELAGRYKEDI